MRAVGWSSETLMEGHFHIQRREDFDRYHESLVPSWVRPRGLAEALRPYAAFAYWVRHAGVVHMAFNGGPLRQTWLRRWEAPLLRSAGVKIVVIPYGGDAYQYSTVRDPSLQYALLASYPAAARREDEIAAQVRYWSRYADAVITGGMLDGLPRTDVLMPSGLFIDTADWRPPADRPGHDGRTGPVRVLHTPNHRGFKGTEFITDAVATLQAEGLQVELVLLERQPNAVVRETMQTVDILIEQLIAPMYGMSGLEGMASGLTVLGNLDVVASTEVFRRFSFLDECPVLSATPETVTAQLRLAVTRPDVRRALGAAGRQYAEQYHSYAAAQHLFGSVYRAILDGEAVDLIHLFHPRRSAFMQALPRVSHPLVRGHLADGA